MKKEFGDRVRALREQAGLSTNKFALMVGLSKSFIIQIEHGRRNISLDTIERIAAGLNMSVWNCSRALRRMLKTSHHAINPNARSFFLRMAAMLAV